jgi:transposase
VRGTVRHERERSRADARLSALQREVAPPISWPGFTDVPLLAAARRLVPPDAAIGFLPGGRYLARRSPEEARAIYLQSGWVRWEGFVLAPRRIATGTGAPWLVLVDQTPRQAGIRPRASWRFRHDWLVRR